MGNEERRVYMQTNNSTSKELFSRIYREGLWGKGESDQPFFSGSGSHDHEITSAYIQAVSAFVSSLNIRPNAVDLGCGDFNVGSRIRQYFGSYIACDIVEPLINFNKKRYAQLNVDFRALDLVEDDLPKADIVFVRQVLQHLSNAQIKKTLPKLKNNFTWLVLTEHIPSTKDFPHNLDQKSSENIRLGSNSGVIITSPPFNLEILEEKVICEVREDSGGATGVIQTIAYRL